MTERLMEVSIVPSEAFLEQGKLLSDLEAQNFIRPNLEVFGKSVVDTMAIYPAEGTRLLSSYAFRKKKAAARQLVGGGFLGSLAARLVSNRDTSSSKPLYKRTGQYGRLWERSTGMLEERLRNLAEYAGYVGGLDASPGGRSGASGNQPYTWRYGWKRLRTVAQDLMDEWILFMEQKAFRLWKR